MSDEAHADELAVRHGHRGSLVVGVVDAPPRQELLLEVVVGVKVDGPQVAPLKERGQGSVVGWSGRP
jgi:hypothetical protein